MNREILFRGKRSDNNEWVYGFLLYIRMYQDMTSAFHGGHFSIYEHTNNNTVAIDTETICQYIGLNDKNGNKIFEGDIVKIGYNFIGNIIVKFENGKANISNYQMNEAKVIGNIYDNPELLED